MNWRKLLSSFKKELMKTTYGRIIIGSYIHIPMMGRNKFKLVFCWSSNNLLFQYIWVYLSIYEQLKCALTCLILHSSKLLRQTCFLHNLATSSSSSRCLYIKAKHRSYNWWIMKSLLRLFQRLTYVKVTAT